MLTHGAICCRHFVAGFTIVVIESFGSSDSRQPAIYYVLKTSTATFHVLSLGVTYVSVVTAARVLNLPIETIAARRDRNKRYNLKHH